MTKTLLTPEEHEVTAQATEEFRRNEGPKLQEHLQKRWRIHNKEIHITTIKPTPFALFVTSNVHPHLCQHILVLFLNIYLWIYLFNLCVTMVRLNMKMPSCRSRNFHYKDRTVVRNTIHGKLFFILKQGPNLIECYHSLSLYTVECITRSSITRYFIQHCIEWSRI